MAAGDSPSIKDAELKELDSALGGVITELVQIHEFSGKAVSNARERMFYHCSCGWPNNLALSPAGRHTRKAD